ncbi:MAG: ADP-ribosylglycohydrolase family protein, partial [Candidatus Eremiobacteraeota bacterium]|nr:ADP-ribosylglycohydrolase family protein [Candidatus Eremiobacteraeota bacterium]
AGYRGSSVAVALVHDGEPILGVVFSPTYPDDRGDLIAWARGEQLQRWPGQLVRPAHQVTLVSQSGDDNVEANLVCLDGGRYQTMPSVAYRFARVAAGEATAGVSLSPTQAHDYAACHALLRAAGLELYNQDGQVVGYDSQARSHSRWLFAGRQELHRRPWQTVFQRGSQQTPLPYPVRARHRVSDPDRLARLQGAILGQLVGDSLGSQTEFSTPEQIARDFPAGPGRPVDGQGPFNLLAGQPTDDSEMALCLARALIEGSSASLAYQHWYESGPFDIGRTTFSALKLGVVSVDSQANGSLMRCSPLALAFRGETLNQQARLDSGLTHANPLCGECCAVYLTALAAGLDGAEPRQAFEQAYQLAGQPVRELLDAALAGPPATYLHQAGWVKIAFHNAFYQLMSGRTLMEGLLDTARQGGDADTNAAIAGALLGAFGGRQAVAPEWLCAVLT